MSICVYSRSQNKKKKGKNDDDDEKEEAMNGDCKISKGLKHAQNIKIMHEIKSGLFFFLFSWFSSLYIFNNKQADKHSPPALKYKFYNGTMTWAK